MSYVKTVWAAGVTPLSAGNLNNLEDGLEEFGLKSGEIVIWHGTIASIPAGRYICDGNNGTPNLLTNFVQGVATAATNPGATGGATAKTTAGHTHTLAGSGTSDRSPGASQVVLSAGVLVVGAGGGASESATGTTVSSTDSIADIRPKFYDVAFLMKS